MQKLTAYVLGLVLLISLAGCQGPQYGSLYQVSTIDALLAGDYAGHLTVGELLEHGDFGIGTFRHVDGEMVVLDGVCYQVGGDGSVRRMPATATTPFATVTWFSPDISWAIDQPTSLTTLQAQLDRRLPSANWFYAVRVHGSFETVRSRSVPAQHPPYVPLAQVVQNQNEWTLEQTAGTLVGFRCPPYVSGVNVPGDHWHYLTDDRTGGGHVMDFLIHSGRVDVTIVRDVRVMLPASDTFANLDLGRQRNAELQAVEMMPKRDP